MRRSCAALALTAALLCGGCGSGPKPPAGGSDTMGGSDAQALEQLKGTWHVVGIEAAGQRVPAERVQKIALQYVFDGDKVTIRRPDQPDATAMVTLNTFTAPKRMTMHLSPPVRAAYSVDGNKLRLCLMVDEAANADFPTEVASRASPKTDLLILERR